MGLGTRIYKMKVKIGGEVNQQAFNQLLTLSEDLPASTSPWTSIPIELPIGENVVVNGAMETDTVWTKSANWTIASEVATADGTSSDTIKQTGILSAGSYRVSFEIMAYTSGDGFQIRAGSGTTYSTEATTVGIHSFVQTATEDFALYIKATGSTIGNISNVVAFPLSNTTLLKDGDKVTLVDAFTKNRATVTIATDQSATDTSLTVESFSSDFGFIEHSQIIIDQEDLAVQYQHKTRGTVAGFTVDADGLAKGGIEITGWLDSDAMTGATANNLATAESIKAYVDAQTHTSDPEYLMATCSTYATTSATAGEANAVVIPFNQATQQSSGTVIFLSEEEGANNTVGITTTGVYDFHWNVASTVAVVANRLNCGVKLQKGLSDGEGGYEFSDLDPSHCYIYSRANSTEARLGSTSASIIVAHNTDEADYVYRLVIWKDTAANASTKGITEIDGTQITITKIE